MMKANRANAARSRPLLLLVTLALLWLGAPLPGLAQPAGCDLVPDDRHPDEEILRCGDRLTIHAAANTKYRIEGQVGQEPPTAARIEFRRAADRVHPERPPQEFSDPHAARHRCRSRDQMGGGCAARPHRNAGDWRRGRGLARRAGADRGALLHPGEGADVTAKPGPIVVKRWSQARIDALLARLGQ